MLEVVCFQCFGNKSLRTFIKKNAAYNYCDVCHRHSNKNISISIDDLIDKIKQSIANEYVDPNDLLMSDDEEGWSMCLDSYDMFIDDDVVDIQCKSDELRTLISNRLSDKQWFLEANYYQSFSENLLSSWDYYSKIIKEKWRYTFFFEEPSESEPAMLNAEKLFDEIWKLIENHSLVTEIDNNTCIYRSRSHKKTDKIINAHDIGTPESKYIKSANRLSPIGIPLFYGSFDKHLTQKEMQVNKGNKYYSTGTFKLNKAIKVIDLSNYLVVPGYFEDGNEEIDTLEFLNSFIELISKPILPDEEYLEYIPTQIFVEYLRHKSLKDKNIKGIIYKSSKEDSKNIALFYSSIDCKDKLNVNIGEDCLVLDSIEHGKI